jgi:hypothetical protein
MGPHVRAYRDAVLIGFLVVTLAACSGETDSGTLDEADTVDEVVANPTDAITLTFRQPSDCTGLLPNSDLQTLAEQGIALVRGPGSNSAEPIFVEGQTPEELVGGISCLYSVPEEEDSGIYIILSVAPIDQAVRPGVINDLLGQNLNVGQSPDGALTYWIWGDDVIVPALHNALYEDSWYSALLQPGGRNAYDQGVALVQSMRTQTTE